MPVVNEDQRLHELRRLGMSEPLIRLSSGECVHEIFKYLGLSSPYYAYRRARVADNLHLIPLWDRSDLIVGIRELSDGAEFIEFSIEAPDDIRCLARTEQGFWITQFDLAYENDASTTHMREAADRIGFRFFEQYLSARESMEDQLSTFDAHRSWLCELVGEIDRVAHR